MKVEYISHACLLIDTGDVRIATDPWFAGPAYSQQWYVFPKPVNAQACETADVIAISHGHEDHFHPRTLRGLSNKTARVFYPFSWFGGAKEFINSLGFSRVTEAVSWRKYRLADGVSITYVANGHDNIMVIESGKEVLVNVNDALHSEANATIDFFIHEIGRNWPRVDVLFCGFGGASYFPNMLHVSGKNDHAAGAVREHLFAHNFCRVVAGLKPRVAVPFAADFALLAPAERWINEVRFPRSLMKDYFERQFANAASQTQVQVTAQPAGDCAVVITAPSRILRYATKHEFGGDAIGIGYGADFQLREFVSANLDLVCYQLLTRMPTRKAYLRENPPRVAGFVLRQPPLRTVNTWRKSRAGEGAVNYDRSIWLLRDVGELRKIYDLPDLEKSIVSARN